MPNPEWTVNALEFRGGYVLRLWFEDGSIKDFDCRELLDDKVYSSLHDMSFFRQAQALYGTVRWSDEIDIAPEYLYEHGKDITSQTGKSKINWEEFTSQDKENIRDGLSPEDYVKKLRNFDRIELPE